MPFLLGGAYALHHYTGIPKIEVFGRKVPVAPPEECHGHGPVSRLLGDADPNGKLKTEDRKLKTGSRNGFPMARGGIEPPTRGFSVLCSTN